MDELTRAIAALENMKGDVVASLAKAKDGDSYLSGMKSAYVLALLTLRGIELLRRFESEVAEVMPRWRPPVELCAPSAPAHKTRPTFAGG